MLFRSNFKRLAVEPLKGFGEDLIYFSQLGIKTDSNGDYYLDDFTFEKTLSTNPEYFNALKDENLSTNSASVTATKSQFTRIDEGTYTVTKVGDDWKFGDADLIQFVGWILGRPNVWHNIQSAEKLNAKYSTSILTAYIEHLDHEEEKTKYGV